MNLILAGLGLMEGSGEEIARELSQRPSAVRRWQQAKVREYLYYSHSLFVLITDFHRRC